MKTKKMLLIVIIAAALGVGWLLSVRTASGTEVIKEQRNLVKEADELAARKLYVRAIELYEEALSQSSRLTPIERAEIALAVEAQIVAKEPIAQKAIPNCNITYIDKAEMKQALSGYLDVLFHQDSLSIGGGLPESDFYYDAE